MSATNGGVFECRAALSTNSNVGYQQASCAYGNDIFALAGYCTNDKLALRLSANSYELLGWWHYSDVAVSYLCGAGSSCSNALHKSITITDAMHSTRTQEDFTDTTDARDTLGGGY